MPKRGLVKEKKRKDELEDKRIFPRLIFHEIL
jgi:hypothetical protein